MSRNDINTIVERKGVLLLLSINIRGNLDNKLI